MTVNPDLCCPDCEHTWLAHNPAGGCRANDCLCTEPIPESMLRPKGRQADQLNQRDECGNCGHPRGMHDDAHGCETIACRCSRPNRDPYLIQSSDSLHFNVAAPPKPSPAEPFHLAGTFRVELVGLTITIEGRLTADLLAAIMDAIRTNR